MAKYETEAIQPRRRRQDAEIGPLTPEQQALVERHVVWANSGAAKFYRRLGRRCAIDELRSAAYMGLVQAALRFEPARGFVFKTYAMPWCEAHMLRLPHAHLKAQGAVRDAAGYMRPHLRRVELVHPDTGRVRSIPDRPADLDQAILRRQQLRVLSLVAKSETERGVLTAALRGDAERVIASRLGLAPATVRATLARLTEKVRALMQVAA